MFSKNNKKYSYSLTTTKHSCEELNNSLIVTPSKESYPVSSSSYGLLHEDSIYIKPLLNLPIEAINEPKIFCEENVVRGLKLILIPSNESNKLKYIDESLLTGNFKVIPYLNMEFTVSFDDYMVYFKYSRNSIYIQDQFGDAEQYNNFHYYDNSNPKNIFKGYIFIDELKKYQIFIFEFKCQVDGIFKSQKEFSTSDFKSFIIDSAKKNLYGKLYTIPKDSILIYETKSGDSIDKLTEQISKKCKFLENFFNSFSQYKANKVIFFGFNYSRQLGKYNASGLMNNNINVVLINVFDGLFGEKIYCKNEQINLLKTLKEKVGENSQDIKEVKQRVCVVENMVGDLSINVGDLSRKIDLILQRLPAPAASSQSNKGQ